ncbi:YgaP family membrane protein [Roseobacter sp. CCS2]|uniref:YgaP family membrane protein n=1 Tax=Roseobacter sp. CCS2 TaxID=391593 RepID=UPI0000F3C42D|nr:DUF2892 domain-containing protein [Roseobacter sp. CCS2]EBA11872.1 hypothetical protein RCCS2_18126 [Roseobacter sp. CCS2]
MSLLKKLTTRNVGTVDRLIRTLPAVAVLILWAGGMLNGTALIITGVIAAMLLVTAITGMCSIYAMLGFSTYPVKQG